MLHYVIITVMNGLLYLASSDGLLHNWMYTAILYQIDLKFWRMFALHCKWNVVRNLQAAYIKNLSFDEHHGVILFQSSQVSVDFFPSSSTTLFQLQYFENLTKWNVVEFVIFAEKCMQK